ncbi:DUF222 domain-containing protein [Luteococcus sp. OSA5]|uniref:DUF222 domain-containing protein n=1 Tax=Luteococcus sp. OSA5 TaxID=3401630 RepID=UPI003B43A039
MQELARVGNPSSVADRVPMEHLSSAQTVGALLAARRRAWQAEAEQFALAAHFADLHAVVPEDGPVVFGERMVHLGGDGTPEVAEFAPLEIAAALTITREAAELMIGDALALRHRLPLLWQKMHDGELRVGVARVLVMKSRSLPLREALELDRRIAPLVGGMSPGRLVRIAEGHVLELTPQEDARTHHELAMATRGVWLGESEDGVAPLQGRLAASDAIFLDAQLDRVATILAQGGHTESVDVRRATALGILASPARALQLIQASLLDEVDDPALPLDTDAARDESCPAAGQRGHTCGAVTVDPELLLPRSTVVVHLAEQALAELDGVARMERSGPVLVEWLEELLGHSRVTLKPVVDPAVVTPSDRYEVSHRMRQVVIARNPVEVFPGSKKWAESCDLDHTEPWRPPPSPAAPPESTAPPESAAPFESGAPESGGRRANGERDQPPRSAPATRPENLGPLSRTVHRAKTHGGWQLRQLAPGMFFWRSPDGFAYLVTPSRSWMIHNPVTPAG